MSALPDTLGAASARRYLRGNLPAIYSENRDGRPLPVMSLLEGLERVLDPVVIVLDNLVSYVEPATAPAELVDFLLELTGAPVDPTLPLEARRDLAIDAARIARARGTKAGLQLALQRAFPDLKPGVRDRGRVSWGRRSSHVGEPSASSPGAPPPSAAARPASSFEVLLAREPGARRRAQLARCIADHLPLGASYTLSVAGG